MTIRRALLVSTFVATAAVVVLSVGRPVGTAAQAPVDKTGLDILCSGKGDTYSPPNAQGISNCIFADQQVMTCDSKTDKCYSSKDAKGKPVIVEGALLLRQLKLLNDKVDALTVQVQSLKPAGR